MSIENIETPAAMLSHSAFASDVADAPPLEEYEDDASMGSLSMDQLHILAHIERLIYVNWSDVKQVLVEPNNEGEAHRKCNSTALCSIQKLNDKSHGHSKIEDINLNQLGNNDDDLEGYLHIFGVRKDQVLGRNIEPAMKAMLEETHALYI